MSAPPDEQHRPAPPVEVEHGWPGRPLAEVRWSLETARLLADPVFYGVGVPRGDGRRVLLLPGFLASDYTLNLLRTWLHVTGYAPRVTGFRFNVDCSDRALDRIERFADMSHHQSGRRVAVIGHSRGGHFARALGARRPDLVSHVISMGSDLQALFGISEPTRAAVGMARRAVVASRRSREPECFRSRCACRFVQDYHAPFPVETVRLTSIYSKGDGVVRWQRAIVDEATNVEVSGSHIGLAANRKAYHAIAAALAAPELGLEDGD